MTKLIIEIVLAVWLIGTGIARAVKITRGELFAIGIGDWVWFFIDGDYIPFVVAYFPLPLPFARVWPKLKWEEMIEGKNKKTLKIKNVETGKEEDKFKEIVDLPNAPNYFMGTRSERVPTIHKYEPVGYNATVITKDGYELEIVVKFIFKVFRPVRFIRIPTSKMIGDIETQNKLKVWAKTKTLDEVHATNFDIMSSTKDDIIVLDEDGRPIELTTYLDQKHFLAMGFKIFKLGWKLFNSAKAQEYFDLQNKGQVFAQQKKNAEKYGELRDVERDIEIEDGIAQNMIIEDRIQSIRNGAKGIIEDIYEGKRKVAAAQPFNLVKIEHEADEIGEKTLEKLMDKIPTINDTTSAKQFRKEEEQPDSNTQAKTKQKKQEVKDEN